MITTFGTTEQGVTCLKHWLSHTFKSYTDKDLTIALVRNRDDMKSFGSIQNSQTSKPTVNFPFMRLTIASYALDTSRGGGKKHVSIPVGKDDAGKTQMLALLPIKLGIAAKLQCDDLTDILRFCHMIARHFPSVSYNLEYETGINTPVKISMEPQYNISEANLSSAGDPFEWETTFILDILDGELSVMPSIKNVKFSILQANGYGKSVADADKVLIDQLNLKFPDIHTVGNVPYLGEYDAENTNL